jgi:putative Holliday junction resolvase|tara:strand:- start:328 stop:708 length:381 start_codon:yes stop_codon:yes gene_type:complete
MKIYLGIDYGKSKIGLAKADEETRIATPLRVLRGGRVSGPEEVKKVVQEEEVDEIVVGYPLSLSGEAGAQAKEVDEFIKELESSGKPVHRQDERFSSRDAVSENEDDASAAALILKTYIDSITTSS